MFHYVWFKGEKIPFILWMIYSPEHLIMVSSDNVHWHMASNTELTFLVK